MTFYELQQLFQKHFGIKKLADIARELDVTPQVVSNWKSRNQVPYKYIKKFKLIVDNNQLSGSGVPRDNNINSPSFNDSQLDYSFYDIFLIFFNLIKRNIFIFFIIPVIASFITAFYVLYISPIVYKSDATILPVSSEGNDDLSSISVIANQYGIGPKNSRDIDFTSSQLIPYVIKSRKMAKALLNREFETSKFGKSKKLIRIILNDKEESNNVSDIEIQKGMSVLLSSMINVSKVQKTPLINITAFAFEPKLSSDLVIAVIEELNKVHTDYKLSSLNEKKIYIEARKKEVLKDLTFAEDNLKEFREKNRIIASSPALLLEQERQIRELEVLNQVYITLKREWEVANIEFVQKNKSINILDHPEVPSSRMSPRRTYSVFLSLFLGFLFSTFFLFCKDVLFPQFQSNKNKINYKKLFS